MLDILEGIIQGCLGIEGMAYGASRDRKDGYYGSDLNVFYVWVGEGWQTLDRDGTMDLRLRLTLASNASIRGKYRVFEGFVLPALYDGR